VATIRQFAGRLQEAFGLPEAAPGYNRSQSEHDNLQAVVAALPAAGLLEGPCHAVPKGLPALLIGARDAIPMHRTEGIIWDAMPIQNLLHTPVIRQTTQATPRPQPKFVETDSSGGLMPETRGVERGIRLFAYLVELANRGEAVGLSYGGFIAYLHEATEFREVAGRSFLPSDSMAAVRIASRITAAAGGRKRVARSGTAIDAGMDTFIWRNERPFDRPIGAWSYALPYTRQQWLSVFPDGARRLISPEELREVVADDKSAENIILEQKETHALRDFPFSAPEYLSPVLRILEDGNEHSVAEIRERILAEFCLTPEQLSLFSPSRCSSTRWHMRSPG